jgi:phage shock protein PspC (stress-responsive transcriptional regulator)
MTGVAGGLALYLDVDPSLVRVAWVVLAFLTGGLFALVYIVMAIVVPMAPPGWTGRRGGPWGPGAGAYPGWASPTGGGARPSSGPGTAASAGAAGTTGVGTGPQPLVDDDATQAYPGTGWPEAAEGQAAGWDTGSSQEPSSEPLPGAVPGWQGTEAPVWGTPPDQGPPARGGESNAPLIFGAILILLGAWFLIERFVNINFGLVWPVIVIGLGVVLILGAMRRGDR